VLCGTRLRDVVQVGDEALQQALTEARVEAQHAQADLAAVRAELEALRRSHSSPEPNSPAREPGAYARSLCKRCRVCSVPCVLR